MYILNQMWHLYCQDLCNYNVVIRAINSNFNAHHSIRYGHVDPAPGLTLGHEIAVGEMIGKVAQSSGSVPSHLHLTTVWADQEFSCWTWHAMTSTPNRLLLTSPLRVRRGAVNTEYEDGGAEQFINAEYVHSSSFKTLPEHGPYLMG